MFPTRILLATDGSREASCAARFAVELSNELNSELHVVYVEVVPSTYAAAESEILDLEFYEKMRERAEEVAKTRLEEQVEKLREAGGDVVEAYSRVGRPHEEIVCLAEEIAAGLVVLGSRGLGPFRRALMGSVSRSVVLHAHCSVLVVRGTGGEEGRGYLSGKTLVAFDGSTEAAEAARAATEIAGATESELHVTYAIQQERYRPHLGPEVWEGWEIGLEKAKRRGRSWLQKQADAMQGEGAKAVEAHLILGRPDAAIVQLADGLDARLVVVGSRGLGRIRRSLLGSVSDSVVRHAHCSVLVVRS